MYNQNTWSFSFSLLPSHPCSFCKSLIFLFFCLFFLCFFSQKYTDLCIIYFSFLTQNGVYALCFFPYSVYPAHLSILAYTWLPLFSFFFCFVIIALWFSAVCALQPLSYVWTFQVVFSILKLKIMLQQTCMCIFILLRYTFTVNSCEIADVKGQLIVVLLAVVRLGICHALDIYCCLIV